MIENDNQEIPLKKTPYYKNSWFWIAIGILLVVGVLEVRNFNIKQNKTVQTAPQLQQEQTESTLKANSNSIAQEIQNSTFDNAKSVSFTHNDVVKTVLEKGFMVENDQNTYYPHKKYIVLKSRDFDICVEDFTLGYDLTDPSGECRLKVSVMLDNPSDNEFKWSHIQFKAIDSRGYSYSPITYGVRGDLYGTIPPQELRRCQIVFKVPAIRQPFILTYTDQGTKERVKFSLNTEVRENERYQEQMAANKKGN